MSITSSNNQGLHPDFTDLLARHAGLAGWLASTQNTGEARQAEDLLPRFLAECAEQGILATAYPFTAEDRGLADLRVYLQRARDKIDTFHFFMPDLSRVEQADTPVQDEDTHRGEASTDKLPVPSATSQNLPDAEPQEENPVTFPDAPADDFEVAQEPFPDAPAHIFGEAQELFPDMPAEVAEVVQLPFPDMPVVAQEPFPDAPADDFEVAQEPFPGMPAEVAEVAQESFPNGDAEVAEVAQEAFPDEPGSANDDAAHAEVKGEDVAQLETAHMPVAGGTEVDTTEENPVNVAAALAPAEVSDADTTVEGAKAALAPAEVSDAEIPADLAGADTPGEVANAARVASPGRRARAAVRRQRSKRPRRPRSRRQRIVTWVVLIAVLATVLVPAISLVNFGLSAYSAYRDLSNQAHSAVNHLLDVKTTFTTGSSNKSRLNGFLDTGRLQRAEQDFVASGRDFQQLQKQLKQSSTLHTVTTYFPQYRETLASAQAASQIGIDVAAIGQIAISHAAQIAPSFSGSLLAATGKPLVTQALLDTLNTTIDQVTPLLNDIEVQSQRVSLDSLPISASEKTQVGQLLQLLPQTIADLGVARSMLGDAGWLLGVNQPRTFLVQTMDRAELRGGGGFTGQYGELTVNGGRVAPFSLKDISLVEYTNSSVTQGQLALPQYRSWWPFANWGLRDSNVSADFPTTAQLAINLYKQETGNQVDGVISFTPVVIEHVLAVIGPIQVPGYNTTVTAQNLEDVLHYYQLNNTGILKQILNQPDNNSTSQRKRFTNYLSTLLMAKVRSSSADQVLAIAHQVLADLKSKDLQMYFTDPATENVLLQYGYAGALDRSTTHDGFYVVQQNLSASKASQYVQTILHDTVTLDSKGGATHVLQIRLVYNQAGPVYGYDTYYDYMRVYVPPSSQLLSGDGFSSGTPLCGGAYGNCAVDGPYPGGELTCPAGQYQPGASPPTLTQPDGGTWEPLQTLSGPTNTTSDEAGRAMYGGWVIVPKNCTMNVTLSWYVPPLSAHYALLVQRQAGTFPELDLSILPDAADCAQLETTGLHYDKTLTRDTSFALPAYHASTKAQSQPGCYPQAGA